MGTTKYSWDGYICSWCKKLIHTTTNSKDEDEWKMATCRNNLPTNSNIIPWTTTSVRWMCKRTAAMSPNYKIIEVCLPTFFEAVVRGRRDDSSQLSNLQQRWWGDDMITVHCLDVSCTDEEELNCLVIGTLRYLRLFRGGCARCETMWPRTVTRSHTSLAVASSNRVCSIVLRPESSKFIRFVVFFIEDFWGSQKQNV